MAGRPLRRARQQPLSEWIERTVRLSDLSAAPGPMHLWPWQRGIADAIGDPNIERVTVLKSARVGYTSVLIAALAHYTKRDPCPVLAVLPTIADTRDFIVSDIEPVFHASPALKDILKDPGRTPGDRNTLMHRVFNGGSLRVVAAKAPRNLRRHTARVLLVDEADAMETGAEGDVLLLAERRTLSFDNRKIVVGSTPLDEDTSHVVRLYGLSDQRVFEVPCPDCGARSEILWENIEWQPDKPETAKFRCPTCEALIAEKHKPEMIAAGDWRATAPHVRGHAGFRLNALISPLANASWAKLVSEFLAVKDDPARLRVFVNTTLGQAWRPAGDEIDDAALASRVEPFGLDNIPAEVLSVTIGCDVQDDRLEPTIAGWDRAGNCLVLAHEPIFGPVDGELVWRDLDDLLKSTWAHPHGGALRVDAAVIDAGDGGHYDRVLAFCAARAGRRVLAGKGVSGFGRPAIKRAVGGRQRANRSLWIVGVDGIKQTIATRLARGRSIRFSRNLDAAYFEQLASERRVVRYSRGRPQPRFERVPGRRAEALDALVLATAARAVLSLNLDARETELRAEPIAPSRPALIRSRWMEGRP